MLPPIAQKANDNTGLLLNSFININFTYTIQILLIMNIHHSVQFI